jgi:4-amino-4-deoxy-L-arabinose transferase-like glycosyltransferase
MHRSTSALVFFITIVYLGLAVMSALTMRPWCDEGWFSNPAENLLTTGSMPTSVLDPTASWRRVDLQGIDRHTYWVMPLYILAQAGWYRITGFSLVSMRLLSVLWGLVAIAGWYIILKRLSGSTAVALLAVALLSTDFQFLMTAGNGRMDMMTAALESAALAAYLSLRERNFSGAVLVSQSLAAAGVVTHPMGVLGAMGLVFVTVYSDWKRIRPAHVALAGLPYVVAAAGWTLYILQSPADFMAQFGSNASGRLELFHAPATVLRREIEQRFLAPYGLAAGLPAAARLKGTVLAIYIVSLLAAFADKSIRMHRGSRVLLVLAVGNLIGLTMIDSFDTGWYLIHLIPFAIAVVAVVANSWWSSRRAPRAVIALTLGLLIVIQLTVSVSRIAKNNRSDFVAAADFLRDRLPGYKLVMASAEFGIPLQFDKRLIDDFRLGYRSGKRPDLIVMDTPRYWLWTGLLRDQDAGNYRYIQNLLSRYRVVYDHGAYRMYERSGALAMEAAGVRR